MTGTVLVAVDHAVEASRSMQRVVELAARDDYDVVVLHVHEVAYGRMGRFVVEHEPDEDCIADIVARTLVRAGVRARPMAVEQPLGLVAEAIAEVAAEVGATIVLVGGLPSMSAEGNGIASRVHRLLGASTSLFAVP